MAAKESRAEPGVAQGGNSEEARHLAEEALEERRKGNEEEAQFVLDEARELDSQAVEQVLKEDKHRG